MPVGGELLQTQPDGTLSFGDYTLEKKAKLSDYEYRGDLYKVKTFRELTKLEKNGMLLYESLPGTSVRSFLESGDGLSFVAEGAGDVQVTLGLEEEAVYQVMIGGSDCGLMKTSMGGKLVLSVDLKEAGQAQVTVVRQ